MEQYTNLETHLNRHLGIRPHKCPHIFETPHPHQLDKLVRERCAFRTCDPAELSGHRRQHGDYVPAPRRPKQATRRRAIVRSKSSEIICVLPDTPESLIGTSPLASPQPVHGESSTSCKRKRMENNSERPSKYARREPANELPSHTKAWPILESAVPLSPIGVQLSDLWLSTAVDFEPSPDAEASLSLAMSDWRAFPQSGPGYGDYSTFSTYPGLRVQALSSGPPFASFQVQPTMPMSTPPSVDASSLLWASALDRSNFNPFLFKPTPHEVAFANEMAHAFEEVLATHAHTDCWCHH